MPLSWTCHEFDENAIKHNRSSTHYNYMKEREEHKGQGINDEERRASRSLSLLSLLIYPALSLMKALEKPYLNLRYSKRPTPPSSEGQDHQSYCPRKGTHAILTCQDSPTCFLHSSIQKARQLTLEIVKCVRLI